MLVRVVIVVAVIVAAFLIFVGLQPAGFRITRSVTISAPPETVFAQVNDFHKWGAWSPWEKLDPAMKKTYSGNPSGYDAKYEWTGNSKVGEGRMVITESRPNELINIRLEFLKPFAATNMAEFTFKPQGNQTVVTWSMSGNNNFMSKAFGLFMNMDKMIGGDFEKGLAQLKTVSETPAGK